MRKILDLLNITSTRQSYYKIEADFFVNFHLVVAFFAISIFLHTALNTHSPLILYGNFFEFHVSDNFQGLLDFSPFGRTLRF